MNNYTFEQLVDIGQIRRLLESHNRASGMAYGLFDAEENNLVAVGWQDICVRFHRTNCVTARRCRESDAHIKEHLHDSGEDGLEYRCRNGMIDVAFPLVLEGRHLATFFTGQFFYEDDRPDLEFFIRQGEEFGFDHAEYFAALERVPTFSREHVRTNLIFLRDMVRMLAESGLANLMLAREVQTRRQMEDDLQNKNSELERFTYTVSHDLKSPVITIKSFSGCIKNDLKSGRLDRIEKDLDRICAAADKMTMLLDDLLKLSRIGRVINAPELVDMARLAGDVLKNMDGALTEGSVQVAVRPDLPSVMCDRQRMMEVVQNLVENAIKYRGDQPELRIEIGVRETEGHQVFFVQDNGPGIEPKYHDNIFGLFNRLDTRASGTGIGLALVKRIIETHGGSVWVESDGMGNGSAFCFTVVK